MIWVCEAFILNLLNFHSPNEDFTSSKKDPCGFYLLSKASNLDLSLHWTTCNQSSSTQLNKIPFNHLSASISKVLGRPSSKQSHIGWLTITQLKRHRWDLEEHHEYTHIQKRRLKFLKVSSELLNGGKSSLSSSLPQKKIRKILAMKRKKNVCVINCNSVQFSFSFLCLWIFNITKDLIFLIWMKKIRKKSIWFVLVKLKLSVKWNVCFPSMFNLISVNQEHLF